MIHRLVNLDYPETPAQRRHVEARQLASRRVTVKQKLCTETCCSTYRRLVTTPTKLTALPKRFAVLLASVQA